MAGRILFPTAVAENLIGAAFLLAVFVRYLIFLGGKNAQRMRSIGQES
jgi:hypothetical protein